jgi:NAD(P)-dependent dehydrogenase (short-subunit alcohol dehydrogenase family)
MDIVGRKVVIVGAGSGIGRSVAVAAAHAGAVVVLAGRTASTLEGTAEAIGTGAEIHVVDATRDDDVASLFERIGPFDHLVSTIGQGVTGAIGALPPADIQRAMDAKLWSPILLVRHGAPRVSPDGSFTFFSGIRGARPTARSSITSMVNAGLEAFGKAMALELAPVRVNVISPGIVDSGPFWNRLASDDRERMFDDFARRAPARRVGAPEDQASAVLFAMGNPFLTGAVLAIDGGALLI